MIKPRTTGLLFATGILLVGIIFGILLGGMLEGRTGRTHRGFPGFFSHHQHHGSDAMIRRFSRDLDLTREQQAQFRVLLEVQKNAMNSLMREVRPRIDTQMKTFKTQMRALLTDQQRAKFDTLTARKEARHRQFEQFMNNEETNQ